MYQFKTVNQHQQRSHGSCSLDSGTFFGGTCVDHRARTRVYRPHHNSKIPLLACHQDARRFLNPRVRWQDSQDTLPLNSMVLVAEKDTLLGKWPLGRLIEYLPTFNEKIHTVKVLTATGVCICPVTKLLHPLRTIRNWKKLEFVYVFSFFT